MRKHTKDRDLFTGKAKGTELPITIDAEMLHLLDSYRSDVEERTGCVLTRRQVMEGLIRKVWREKFYEASVLGAAEERKGDK